MVLAVLFVVFSIFAGFYTDWQWYGSVGRTDVFTQQLIIRAVLFVAFTALTALSLWGSATLAYRSRPLNIPTSPEEFALQKYRESLDSFRRVLFIAGPIAFGVLTGLSASSQWKTYLLWKNSTLFGQTDPQFGKDISFYAFDLPFLKFFLGFGFTILIISLIVNIVVHYIYGGLRASFAQSTDSARRHLMFFLGTLALLKAGAYSIDKYSLATKSDSLITGLKYTDVNAIVPAKTILTYIALATAVLFFISMFRSGWSLPFIAFGAMLGASFVIGGLYPSFVQQFQVKPSELQRETPYIQRNLDSTRTAYGLDNVKFSDYAAIDNPSLASLTEDAGTISNIRLLDPALISPTFSQLQQIRGFYAFPDTLDIDRYTIDGVKRGTVVAVREVNLAGLADDQRNWFNDHLVFTHGYGVVAAYENTAQSDGAPKFAESNIPPSGTLEIDQPRVYFGEQSPSYSIVGADGTGNPLELDYPDDKSANGQTNNTYDGAGGVPIGNIFQRALFALNYQEPNIFLSNQIGPDSKILYDRDPKTRVEKVAPWLTLDGDPYPAVVDGKVKWIVDGYTTSNEFPYSARISLRDATADSVNSQFDSMSLSAGNITYIRNAVKATVDAYDGTVTIYAWDESDPILQTWMKAFPGVVQPKSAIPAEVLDHIRYPEDMFKVQRDVLAKYHVSDPQAFYSGQDFWIVPEDPTKPTVGQAQPPYYLTLQMPDQTAPTFSLTTTYAPTKRQTLAAFMSVNSDYGEDYGTIRVLQLPRNTTIPGPRQVQNNFESDPEVSKQLSLLRSGGSEVQLGNLLSLPVGGGLLYFEPVYVRASQGEGYPLLRKVLVSFGSKVAFEDDLATALKKVFSGQTSIPTDPTAPETPATTPEQDLANAILDANQAYNDGVAALAAGDFAAYGEAQARLSEALQRATAAGGVIAGKNLAVTPTPTPVPSPSQSTS
ncbi:MAG: UPF0182 family protein [Actinobacteria bacterium]|uniref:Unannotated protein n=1 Tax=freshwater metagenome TaxID=449393 RepID=A0A6J7BTS4_9ZZZZ|nr:UPF0182 family protein [Actinomycetota bacterium]